MPNINETNIDSYQVFPDLAISKIDYSICESDNPKTGLFLSENPHLISYFSLSENKNDWAVIFLLDNIEKININDFDNYHIFSNMSSNYNSIMIDFLINNPQYINKKNFSYNENDLAVKFLINNQQYIDKENFSCNENDLAVNFIINNPQYISKMMFSRNENNLAVNYVIKNPDYISCNFSLNENDLAVKFLINNPEYMYYDIFKEYNGNCIAIEYVYNNENIIE